MFRNGHSTLCVRSLLQSWLEQFYQILCDKNPSTQLLGHCYTLWFVFMTSQITVFQFWRLIHILVWFNIDSPMIYRPVFIYNTWIHHRERLPIKATLWIEINKTAIAPTDVKYLYCTVAMLSGTRSVGSGSTDVDTCKAVLWITLIKSDLLGT